MKGDLSRLALVQPNYTGVLYQEGRVNVDQDHNAEHFITARIREQMARDVIGTGVAAVPAGESAGFRVTAAQATAAGVTVTLTPGRVWLDGYHVELPATAPVILPAEYFGPPVQDPQQTSASIVAGVRDAVVVESWQEALSAFQDPIELLEPALGGVDTTERIKLYFRLRLFRLAQGEDCHSIADELATDPNDLGRLTVTPSPVVVIGGDCPVDMGGGYTGLEHYLYRVEIDTPANGQARFKWSRFNGGLVGRGSINAAGDTVAILANDQMINHSGLTSFYMEALSQPGPHQPWEVAFTAQASLVSDGVLSLAQPTGAWPAPANVPVFFRLWDGVRPVADFTSPTELENGIVLAFDAPLPATGQTNYRPGDYWTFTARAAGSNFDPAVWPSNAPPHGTRYHRAPLAEIAWPSAVPAAAAAPHHIEDCRVSFPPLTRLRGCCTYTVGDGVSTFGHFNSIQEAVDALPARGGEICLLPGLHRANVRIANLHDIRVHGCGIHTQIIPMLANPNDPIFHIIDSQHIEISSVDLFTPQGNAILAEGTKPAAVADIEIVRCRIVAGLSCIVVANGASVGIRYCRLRVIDRAGAREAILVLAEGGWIERNDIGVVPARRTPPDDGDDDDNEDQPEDPCADPGVILAHPAFVLNYINAAFTADLLQPFAGTHRAIGGIRIAGGSERITILENTINGGAGNGITFGGGVPLAGPVEPAPVGGVDVAINGAGFIHGQVTSLGAPAADVIFSFRRADGSGPQYFATSGTDGVFYILDNSITPGLYRMNIQTPGFAIANVTVGSGSVLVPSTMLIVTMRPVEGRVVEGLAIEEVLIQRNDILHMGLSGIGSIGPRRENDDAPLPVPGRPVILEQFGTIVFQLEIDGNHIRRCVRNLFDQAMLAVAAIRGFGGISLGLCDEVVISANRLEQSGRSHVDPVVGIFIAFVDHVEIHDNRIENNGPFDAAAAQQPLLAGVRGGIVVRALSRLDHMTEIDATDNPAALDQPAARIYDNVVRQPAGQALQLAALGPVAVQNNFFSSSRTGLSTFERLAGVVLIWNEGTREFFPSAGRAADLPPTPDGKTLYSDNQVRFGQQGRSFCGQMLITRGDLGYDSNQSDYLGPGLPIGDNSSMIINTALLTDTVRATDSRFKEGPLARNAPVLSLLSSGTTFNITAHNQGDHCISAFGGNVVDAPNHVLINTFCRDTGPGISDTLVSNGFVPRRG